MPRSWALISAERHVDRLERKAGPALQNPGQVRKELNLAETRAGTFGMTIEERAAAGRRITALAEQLRAVELLPRARHVLEEREANFQMPARAA